MAQNAVRMDIEEVSSDLSNIKTNIEDTVELVNRLSAACDILVNDDHVPDVTMEKLATKFKDIHNDIKELPDVIENVKATLTKKSEELDEALGSTLHKIDDI